MEQVVDNKIYNTRTARLIALVNEFHDSFSDYSEELYITGKGQYFLYGSGGAMSQYAKQYKGGSSGGSKIMLYTKEQAQSFLLENQLVSEYKKEFGEIEEG